MPTRCHAAGEFSPMGAPRVMVATRAHAMTGGQRNVYI